MFAPCTHGSERDSSQQSTHSNPQIVPHTKQSLKGPNNGVDQDYSSRQVAGFCILRVHFPHDSQRDAPSRRNGLEPEQWQT